MAPTVQGGAALPVFVVNDGTSSGGVITVVNQAIRSIKAKTADVTTVVGIAAFNFSAAELAAADLMSINTFNNGANFLCDGSTPTTTFGTLLQAGVTVIVFDGNAEINALKVVSQSGTAKVTIVLYQYV